MLFENHYYYFSREFNYIDNKIINKSNEVKFMDYFRLFFKPVIIIVLKYVYKQFTVNSLTSN